MAIKLVLFSIVMILCGVGMTYYTIDKQSQLSNKCVSTKVQSGFNFILMLSTMLILIPIIQLSCYFGCKCKDADLSIEWTFIYMIILLMLIVAGGVVWNGIDKDPSCSNNNVKGFIKTLVITGSILLSGLIGGIVYTKIDHSTSSNSGSSISETDNNENDFLPNI